MLMWERSRRKNLQLGPADWMLEIIRTLPRRLGNNREGRCFRVEPRKEHSIRVFSAEGGRIEYTRVYREADDKDELIFSFPFGKEVSKDDNRTIIDLDEENSSEIIGENQNSFRCSTRAG